MDHLDITPEGVAARIAKNGEEFLRIDPDGTVEMLGPGSVIRDGDALAMASATAAGKPASDAELRRTALDMAISFSGPDMSSQDVVDAATDFEKYMKGETDGQA